MAELVNDRTTYAPLVLFEYDHEPGTFCLMLTDQHMGAVADLFEAYGHEGGGYSWNSVAEQAVRALAPDLAGRFRTDPEAGMFVAYGKDREALEQLGTLLRDAYHDRAMLEPLVAEAEID